MSVGEYILQKRGVRSDSVWMSRLAAKGFLRYVPLFLDTWVLMRSQFWSRERLENLAARRLETLFERAQKLPYWNSLMRDSGAVGSISVRDKLARLPATSRAELIAAGEGATVLSALLSKSNADQTSGSTGRPLHFFQDWGATLRSCAVTERTFRTAARRRPPIVYVRSRQRYGFTFYKHVWFFARGFSSIPYRFHDFVETALGLRSGFILYGYTSWVREIARLILERGVRLPIEAVMVAGEHLTPHDRALIESAMGTELYTLYASREVGFLGFECEHHRMHLNEEWAYVEIVDEADRALPEGQEGRILVTAFDNAVMPFIRYDTGDRGSISDEPCPCARTLRTLDFRGRTAELIELEDGRTVTLLDIAHAIGSFRDSILQYQIVQNEPMAFTLRLVPGERFDANKDYIESLMIRLLHPRVRLRMEVLESIPEAKSGKAAYFLREFKQDL